MKLLLDTHVFLWLAGGEARLPPKTLSKLEDARNTVFISAVSAWEIAIKRSLGKLRAPDDIAAEAERFRFIELPVTISHAVATEKLPMHHSDPFDRLLIAQAIAEDLQIVTRDRAFSPYGVGTVPA